jgi:uncharacterized CHY-type Zn-finger protein
MHPQLLTIIARVVTRDIMGWWNQRNAQQVQKQKRNVEKIGVLCPHCNKNLEIETEGQWICPYCNNQFSYSVD